MKIIIEGKDCYLTRIDPSRNMYRFYRLSLYEDLFGKVIFIRRWGRIGTKGSGRVVRMTFETLEAALLDFRLWRSRKEGRGYICIQ